MADSTKDDLAEGTSETVDGETPRPTDGSLSEAVAEELPHVAREVIFAKRPPAIYDVDRLRARETARQIFHDSLDTDLDTLTQIRLIDQLKRSDEREEGFRAFWEWLDLDYELPEGFDS